MKVTLVVLLAVLATAVHGADDGFRTFTSQSGKTIKGKIVAYSANRKSVDLETPDGRTASINIAGLSKADQTVVKKWQTGGILGTPAHFKITAKKVMLNKTKDKSGSMVTETKVMAYEVTLKNYTRDSLPPLRIKYGIFYRQQARYSEKDDNSTLSLYVEHKTKAIPPAGSVTFTTQGVKLLRTRNDGRYYSSSDTKDGSLRGIWMRFYLPGTKTHVRELTEPKSLKDAVTWRP